MKYKTILNRILVDPDKKSDLNYKPLTERDTGRQVKLWMPKRDSLDEWIRGTVVAAGEGAVMDNGQRVQMSVKIGDRVILQSPLRELDGFLVATEMDVLAIENKNWRKNEDESNNNLHNRNIQPD